MPHLFILLLQRQGMLMKNHYALFLTLNSGQKQAGILDISPYLKF